MADTTAGISVSAAEQLLRTIAVRIGMPQNDPALDSICQEMTKEYILDAWQLSALDSYQWQSIGAPIGLAVAVRTLASVSTDMPSNVNSNSMGELPSMIRTSNIQSAPDTKRRQSVHQKAANKRRSSFMANKVPASTELLSSIGENRTSFGGGEKNNSVSISQGTSDISPIVAETVDDDYLEPATEADAPTIPASKGKGYEAPHSVLSLRKAFLQYGRLKLIHGRAFPISDKFYQALNYCKSGPELKSQMVFSMELNVLASALFLGAAVELWGAFPGDQVMDPPDDPNEPYVPRNLAMVYHFFSSLSLIVQLTCTSGWIWSLRATSAVSANKFRYFLVQTRFPFAVFDTFSMFGQNIFVLNISLLLGAMVAATTADPLIRQLGYFVPVVILLIGNRFVHNISSFIGRVAYHGLLLTDVDIDEMGLASSPPKAGSAKEADRELTRDFYRHHVLPEDQVLDIYNDVSILNDEEATGVVLPSMLDAVFSYSKKNPSGMAPQSEINHGDVTTRTSQTDPTDKKRKKKKKRVMDPP